MPKFRKKPVIIEAEQFNPPKQIPKGVINVYEGDGHYVGEVTTIHGQKTVVISGDWIIPEPMPGRYYPCKPDIFEKTYEPI